MSRRLPSRQVPHNGAVATAAPSAFHLIATRHAGADRPLVELRADLSDLVPAAVHRHAATVLGAMVARFPGAEVDVQVVDGANVPLFLITGGASSRPLRCCSQRAPTRAPSSPGRTTPPC